MAKAPVPGRVKTRLCPPLEPAGAARVAEAALRDTLASVIGVHDASPVVALDGAPGPWLPAGVRVVGQQGRSLDERIAHVLAGVEGATLVIGMDTPQIRPDDLSAAFAHLHDGAGAVVGPAPDGGYWLLGLARPDPRAVLGVPMSTAATCAQQQRRLTALGLSTVTVMSRRDVDRYEDAVAVAREAPGTRFAQALAEVTPTATTATATTAAAGGARR